jgi:hypothetical protein
MEVATNVRRVSLVEVATLLENKLAYLSGEFLVKRTLDVASHSFKLIKLADSCNSGYSWPQFTSSSFF